MEAIEILSLLESNYRDGTSILRIAKDLTMCRDLDESESRLLKESSDVSSSDVSSSSSGSSNQGARAISGTDGVAMKYR